jgi:hypothetical protein
MIESVTIKWVTINQAHIYLRGCVTLDKSANKYHDLQGGLPILMDLFSWECGCC